MKDENKKYSILKRKKKHGKPFTRVKTCGVLLQATKNKAYTLKNI